jgi:hypothetical protein
MSLINSNKKLYSGLKKDDLKEALETMFTARVQSGEFVLMTGTKGQEMLQEAMEWEAKLMSTKSELDALAAVNAIDSKQHLNLKEMLTSEDHESVVLAMELITIKSVEQLNKIQDGTNIQSGHT